MALDVFQKIRKIYTNWEKGLVVRVDERDQPEDSLANVIGFNLTEQVAKLKKDYGTTKYFAALPTGLTNIYGIDAFRNEALNQEFVVIFGSKADNLPRFWMRPWWVVTTRYTLANSPSYLPAIDDEWIELTESLTALVITAVGANSITVTVAADYATHYFAGWEILDETNGLVFFCEDSTRLSATSQQLILLESTTVSSNRLDPNAEDAVHDNWVPMPSTPATLFDKLADGATTNDNNYIELPRLIANATGCKIRFPAPLLTPSAAMGAMTQVTVRARVNQTMSGAPVLHAILEHSNGVAITGGDNALALQRTYTDFRFTVLNADIASGAGGFTNLQLRLKGTTNTEQLIDVSWVKIDIDYTLVVTTSHTLALFRFPDTRLLAILGSAVGATQWFFGNRHIDKLTMGWQRSAPTREVPLMVQYVKQKFFAQGIQSWQEASDQLFLGREIPQYETLGDLGLSIQDVVSLAPNVLIPNGDVPGAQWIPTPASPTTLFDKVDEPGDADTNDYISSDTSVLDFDTFEMTLADVADDSLYHTGQVRLIIVARRNPLPLAGDPDTVVVVQLVGGDNEVKVQIGAHLSRNWQGFAVVGNLDTTSVNDYYIRGIANHGFNGTQVQIAQIKVELIPALVQENKSIIAIVPEFDGYLRGKVIVHDVPATNYYPQMQLTFGAMTKRLTAIYVFTDNGDANKTLGEYVSGWKFSLTDDSLNKQGLPFDLVNRWVFSNNKYVSQPVGAGADQPRTLPNNRDETALVQLTTFLGYPVAEVPVDISVNWRYQRRVAFGQQALVVCDESDSVLRLSFYDGDKVHNDHVFVDENEDNVGNPIKLFLSVQGELMGIEGQLGRIYAFKRTTLELFDAKTSQSVIYEADVFAKKGIIASQSGIMFFGKFGAYIMPIDGGLQRPISEAIRPEYVAISDTANFPYKQGFLAVECADLGVIVAVAQKTGAIGSVNPLHYIGYVYHLKEKIWWKRQFTRVPRSFTVLADNTVLMATRTPSILKYPDRTTYLDDGAALRWLMETPWLSLDYDDVQKLIRTVLPVILSNNATIQFQIGVYFDRIGVPADPFLGDGAPFDILYATSVNGKFETPLVVKTPNSFREVKFILKVNSNFNDLSIDYQFDVSEIRAYGETSVTGKEG